MNTKHETSSLPAPQPDSVIYVERIGNIEYQLQEHHLDVFGEITLWDSNPRLIPHLGDEVGAPDEPSLEASLVQTPGYGGLRKSVADIGQLEPIYVWKNSSMSKYLVLEGSTRVTILRELSREDKGTPRQGSRQKIRAKVLPPNFPLAHRVILLARIHVRGSGVRSWGRYIEAKFIYDATEGIGGEGAVLSVSELANWMGKSPSWVSRLRDAYKFALQFVEHIDAKDVNVHAQASEYFSTLEEIIKSSGFGPRLKGGSDEAEKLRAEVFDMVSAGVFKEYRDARYMREFYEDSTKWAQLQTHEKEVAHRLANEIKAGNSTAKSRIHNLRDQIARTMAQDDQSVGTAELEELHKCVDLMESKLAGDVGIFRIKAHAFAQALTSASLDDLLSLTYEDYRQMKTGFEDLEDRLKKRASWWPKE
ncbi:hypothetical protein OpiT1DRAFT_03445 [Opitutaceae bacterium TAV1]|nr:hypothetical protein OpiT1DRAFT_03445 [Opitutaceae bacterium TAV1]